MGAAPAASAPEQGLPAPERTAPTSAAGLRVVARDASYSVRGYASFEYVSFCAFPAQVTLLVATSPAAARDMILAIAGAVRPTAGSLRVGEDELALTVGSPFWCRRCARLAPGTVGLGYMSDLAEVEWGKTVEEAVSGERALWAPAGTRRDAMPLSAEKPSLPDDDVLEYLARHRLATQANQTVARLDPVSRVRLSAALAFAACPAVVALDLTDRFFLGVSASQVCGFLGELKEQARVSGSTVCVAVADASLASAAHAAFGLDAVAREELSRFVDEEGAA